MSIPREGSRDTAKGLIISVTPDVCRTPVGSSTPAIPYSVYAIQQEDANTCATVRLTGQRAHNLSSLVTRTHGDEPGTALGVRSGTVGSVVEPKGHSANVRFEGRPAVRHGDEWWMNSRNTIGKLVWVESAEVFAPTPAIDLTHNPQSQLGSAQIEEVQQRGFAAYQVAQAAHVMNDASPRFPTPPASQPSPNSAPDTSMPRPGPGPGPGPAANDNVAPKHNRLRLPSIGTLGRFVAKRLGFVGAVLTAVDVIDTMVPNAEKIRNGADNLDRQANDLLGVDYAGMDGSGALSAGDLATLTAWDNQAAGILRDAAQRIRNEALPVGDLDLARQIEADALAQAAAASRGELAADPAKSEVTDENVRVVAAPNRGGPGGPCDFHQHDAKGCPQNYQSHHIIQDMFFRIGGRNSVLRPNGAPTLGSGMAICLEEAAHSALHDRINGRLIGIGETANLFDLADISADELKKLLKEKGLNCDSEIDRILDEFKKNLGERGNELLGRRAARPGAQATEALRDSWGLPPGR
ncbi:DUF4150 domain-containing protein [Paracoccus sp. 11-3]|uniref:DUF4150 domain-containing protein n=1 Tax=Paracoccus amoyensis TaxID=2760093 RepID=A0A926GE43_9RHOB|nr:DUF4150 domain-containing protein [Paracoccus amoyensis]MBC9248361.1 DUF4150 domain-containing protein [Paracoccus amoyensis]